MDYRKRSILKGGEQMKSEARFNQRIGTDEATKLYQEITERIYQLAQCQTSLEQKRRFLVAVQAKADIYLDDRWID